MGRPLSAGTIAAVKAKLGLPASATHAQVMAAINALDPAPASARPVAASTSRGDRPRRQGEKVVDWAVATGRIAASVASAYRDLPEAAADVVFSGRQPGSALSGSVAAASVSAARPIAPAAGMPPVERVPAADHRWYAANPVLDEVRASGYEQTVRAATSAGQSPPTLFHSGDLPAFTASGIDPQVLKNVPWMARHRIAATADRAEALGLLEYVSGEEGLTLATEFLTDVENREYRYRVENWKNDLAMAAYAREEEAERRRVAAASPVPTKLPEDMTDDEGYEALFGEIDRRDDALIIAEREAIASGKAVGTYGYKGRQTSEERRKPW